jgi:hypothetical protein
MFHFHRKIFLGLILSLAAAGCAAQRAESAPTVEKLTRDDMKYQAVLVEPFTVAPAGVKEKDPEAYLKKAQETCARVLVKSGLFDTVGAGQAPDAAEPALVVRAQLLALRVVSAGWQQWLGGLAGQSGMKVRVTLLDSRTGTTLASSVVEQDAETSGGPWSFGATDRSLPAEVGTRIAEMAALGARK